jgi:hypothetical protein
VSLLESFSTQQRFAPAAPPVADLSWRRLEIPAVPEIPLATELGEQSLQVASRGWRTNEPLRWNVSGFLPRQPEPAEYPQLHNGWPIPETLVEQLAALRTDPVCGPWSSRVLKLLEQLASSPSLGSPHSGAVLGELEAAVANPPPNSEITDRQVAADTARARYALHRRLLVWRQVHGIVNAEPTWRVSFAPQEVAGVLDEIDALLPRTPLAAEWRKYLLVDHLYLAARDRTADIESRRMLARRILERIDSMYLTAGQRAFLQEPAMAKLAEHLHRWAYEPLDYAQLLLRLEEHERRKPQGSGDLAEDWRSLRWSPWSETEALADLLDTHYRNANVRVAISSQFINRLLPEMEPIDEDVNDHILGTPVSGRSRTLNRLFVELIPDRLRWRMGLVARGQVDSETRAEKGSVTLFSSGATMYRVRKLLTVDRRGVLFHGAEAEADNYSELTDVATAFDEIPLVGSLMRTLARRGHSERIGDANAEVEYKVSNRVAERLDQEVAARLAEAEEKYRQKLLKPMHQLRLNPVALDMQTTEQRLIVRYRLAADNQLAAHTPRPLAPGDSWLSVQLNESAINNIIERLKLSGRRVALRDLYCEIGQVVGHDDVVPPDDLPDDLIVRFADQDPVVVRFHEGRVELTMRFAEMQSGRNSWHNFEVFTGYSGDTDGHLVRLVREDIIELRGYLGFRDKLPLRAIFNAMLARERPVTLLDPAITGNPRLADLKVTQYEIRDGWIGVALSPRGEAPLELARRRGAVRATVSDARGDE